MGIELRPASEDDIDTLNGMVRAYYVHDGVAYEELPARRALQEIIRSEQFGRAWLIDLDKELIGYAVLTFGFSVEFHDRHAVLDENISSADHQGKGHFKEILTRLRHTATSWEELPVARAPGVGTPEPCLREERCAVPDTTRLDGTGDEFVMSRFDVGDDQSTLGRARRGRSYSLAERDGAR